jgi:hypothetical protein
MTVTAASFVTNFPEFANATNYPVPSIDFWISIAGLQFDVSRWGTLYDYGIQLYVAHNLTLSQQAVKAASRGQNPGAIEGPLTNASVDKVSYARNPALAVDPKNGELNLSTYGIRLVRLIKMIGAGPIYVGVGETPSLAAGAWSGPYPYPAP